MVNTQDSSRQDYIASHLKKTPVPPAVDEAAIQKAIAESLTHIHNRGVYDGMAASMAALIKSDLNSGRPVNLSPGPYLVGIYQTAKSIQPAEVQKDLNNPQQAPQSIHGSARAMWSPALLVGAARWLTDGLSSDEAARQEHSAREAGERWLAGLEAKDSAATMGREGLPSFAPEGSSAAERSLPPARYTRPIYYGGGYDAALEPRYPSQYNGPNEAEAARQRGIARNLPEGQRNDEGFKQAIEERQRIAKDIARQREAEGKTKPPSVIEGARRDDQESARRNPNGHSYIFSNGSKLDTFTDNKGNTTGHRLDRTENGKRIITDSTIDPKNPNKGPVTHSITIIENGEATTHTKGADGKIITEKTKVPPGYKPPPWKANPEVAAKAPASHPQPESATPTEHALKNRTFLPKDSQPHTHPVDAKIAGQSLRASGAAPTFMNFAEQIHAEEGQRLNAAIEAKAAAEKAAAEKKALEKKSIPGRVKEQHPPANAVDAATAAKNMQGSPVAARTPMHFAKEVDNAEKARLVSAAKANAVKQAAAEKATHEAEIKNRSIPAMAKGEAQPPGRAQDMKKAKAALQAKGGLVPLTAFAAEVENQAQLRTKAAGPAKPGKPPTPPEEVKSPVAPEEIKHANGAAPEKISLTPHQKSLSTPPLAEGATGKDPPHELAPGQQEHNNEDKGHGGARKVELHAHGGSHTKIVRGAVAGIVLKQSLHQSRMHQSRMHQSQSQLHDTSAHSPGVVEAGSRGTGKMSAVAAKLPGASGFALGAGSFYLGAEGLAHAQHELEKFKEIGGDAEAMMKAARNVSAASLATGGVSMLPGVVMGTAKGVSVLSALPGTAMAASKALPTISTLARYAHMPVVQEWSARLGAAGMVLGTGFGVFNTGAELLAAQQLRAAGNEEEALEHDKAARIAGYRTTGSTVGMVALAPLGPWAMVGGAVIGDTIGAKMGEETRQERMERRTTESKTLADKLVRNLPAGGGLIDQQFNKVSELKQDTLNLAAAIQAADPAQLKDLQTKLAASHEKMMAEADKVANLYARSQPTQQHAEARFNVRMEQVEGQARFGKTPLTPQQFREKGAQEFSIIDKALKAGEAKEAPKPESPAITSPYAHLPSATPELMKSAMATAGLQPKMDKENEPRNLAELQARTKPRTMDDRIEKRRAELAKLKGNEATPVAAADKSAPASAPTGSTAAVMEHGKSVNTKSAANPEKKPDDNKKQEVAAKSAAPAPMA